MVLLTQISRLGVAVLAAVFGWMLVALSEQLSPLWLVLVAMMFGLIGLLLLHSQPRHLLFVGYATTMSMGITKGLIAGHGPYMPALYISLSDVFLVPLLTLRLLDALRSQPQRAHQRLHPIVWAAGLWLLWQWVSALHAPDTQDALLMALNHSKFFLALWLMQDMLRQPGHWRLLLIGITLGLLAHGAMALAQVLSGGRFELQGIAGSTERSLSFAGAGVLHLVRPSGLLSHPNLLAGFLVLVLPTLLGLLLLRPRDMARTHAFWLAVAAGALLLLALTMSRGGWIALAGGMAVYLMLGYRSGLLSWRRLQQVLVWGMVLACLLVALLPGIYLRLVESDNRSTRSRVLMATQAMLIIRHHPLLGVGLAGYNEAARQHTPPAFGPLYRGYAKQLSKGLVHNKYLLVMAETGVVGLLLFLNVFRTALVHAWRRLAEAGRPSDPVQRVLLLGVLCGLLALLITYLAEPAETGVVVELAWVALGALAALTARPSSERQPC